MYVQFLNNDEEFPFFVKIKCEIFSLGTFILMHSKQMGGQLWLDLMAQMAETDLWKASKGDTG